MNTFKIDMVDSDDHQSQALPRAVNTGMGDRLANICLNDQ